jgi:hypothetical protein
MTSTAGQSRRRLLKAPSTPLARDPFWCDPSVRYWDELLRLQGGDGDGVPVGRDRERYLHGKDAAPGQLREPGELTVSGVPIGRQLARRARKV